MVIRSCLEKGVVFSIDLFSMTWLHLRRSNSFTSVA
jgi:hypothetical protein